LASSNEQLAVTPPEFPSSPASSPFENMDLSHSKSPIPTENTESRLAELEAKLANQEAKNTQVLDVLNTTLRLLAAMTPTPNRASANITSGHFRYTTKIRFKTIATTEL
jgi:hypothetical protein